jgi:preprotein translocase subunit SecB
MTTSKKSRTKLRFEDTENAKPLVFQTQRIYIKEQSIDIPYAPGLFKAEWKPEVTNELRTESKPLENNVHEVSVKLTVLLKNQQVTAASIKVHQSGLFLIQDGTPDQQEYLLKAGCFNLLYPYAARAVNILMADASLPPLILAPVNFDALYQQAKTPEPTAHVKSRTLH